MTKGNAVPSLRPATPVKLKRSLSRSPSWLTCTALASTGSVGAVIPARSIAAPSEKPHPNIALPASSATVTGRATKASRTASAQRPSSTDVAIFNPALKTEMRTASSASSSMTCASSATSRRSRPVPRPDDHPEGEIDHRRTRRRAVNQGGRKGSSTSMPLRTGTRLQGPCC